jgi:ketopantoate reductase PanE/ApbA-like protein
VLVSVKSYDTDRVASMLGSLLGDDTAVVSLQNGVDNEERLAAVLGDDRVVGVGEWRGGDSQRVTSLVESFRAADVTADDSPNIGAVLWRGALRPELNPRAMRVGETGDPKPPDPVPRPTRPRRRGPGPRGASSSTAGSCAARSRAGGCLRRGSSRRGRRPRWSCRFRTSPPGTTRAG